MRQTVGILGTPVDVLDTKSVLDRIEQFIGERRFHQVATANTDFLINAIEDPELRAILRNADLVIPDGMPLLWASRLMRSPLPERVTGADLVPQLAALAASRGYRVFMLGARPDIAATARDRLIATYPGLKIVGCVSPPLAPLMDMDHEALLAEICAARPDILLVAFGNPKQEKWIHMNRRGLVDVPVCIGVGGTFDFIAGNTPRAPHWMQKSGLEWVHRLAQEPRRLFGRYRRDVAQFSRYLFRQWAVMRRQSFAGSSEVVTASAGSFTVVSVIGDLDGRSVPKVQAAASAALEVDTDIVLDLQRVSAIDGEGLGMLINLPKRTAAHRREMRLAGVPPFVAAILRGSQLTDGSYTVAPTLAAAFESTRQEGLSWSVRRVARLAHVAVRGRSDPESVSMLEVVCAGLLDSGRSVDLDLSGVEYGDLCLLDALNRLAGAGDEPSELRVVPGDAVRAQLEREGVVGRFTLVAAPDARFKIGEAASGQHDLREILQPEAVTASSRR